MKIAVHQMCSSIDPEQNCDAMIDAVYQSAQAGAEMYFAPEMSMLIDRDRSRARKAVDYETESHELARISQAAREKAIWVHLGSLPVRIHGSEKFANRAIIFGPDGSIRARYDKMHLFDVNLSTGETWLESKAYQGGAEPVAVETPLGLMGLSICYDLRFPDLFSAYCQSGVDVMAVPSAFTVPTGDAHWHILVRARAIESEAFIVAAAQCGIHEDGRQTFGHSLVVDPWGDIVLDMGDMVGLGFADLDLDRLAQVRAQIPVRTNRRDISMQVKLA
jgi:deaminated glutathione amidase